MQKDKAMLHENEVVMLLLGIGVFLFMLLNRVHIRRIYGWKILVYSYSFLLAGWLLTVLEGFFLESYLNFLEHMSYVLSAVTLVLWCFRILKNSRTEEHL